jgi:hypothetical protein
MAMQQSGGALSAPRLVAGGYVAWRPRMEAYFMRLGTGDAHCVAIPEWDELVKKEIEWNDERRTAAFDLALGLKASSAVSAGVNLQVAEARVQIRDLLARSRKAYAALYEALPEELQLQVAHIASGYAHGLWMWLQNKFQSRETDAVHSLIKEWMDLKMNDEEMFDAYRARAPPDKSPL